MFFLFLLREFVWGTNFSNQYFKLSFPSSFSLYHVHIYKCIYANLHITCSCWYNHHSICTNNFFWDKCRGTKNHNLIDNMNKKLEQTHKKISAVKRKCTETAKTCLQMHVENVSKKKVIAWECSKVVSLMSTSFILSQSCFMNSVTQSKDFCGLINDCSMIPIFFPLTPWKFRDFHLNILCIILRKHENDFFAISINFFNPFIHASITHTHTHKRPNPFSKTHTRQNRSKSDVNWVKLNAKYGMRLKH